jgi:hypothetical protein
LREQLRRLEAAVEELKKGPPPWTREDSRFLTWVLGFTAGHHPNGNLDQNERIVAWCRELDQKFAAHERGVNPT